MLRDLIGKTEQIVPKRGQWRVLYLGFAREGWTNAAQTFARAAGALTVTESANWQPAGMVLLSLSQVDADLRRWVQHG